MNLPSIAKAIVGALIAGVTALATGLTDGRLSTQEIVAAVLAFLIALGGVYATPNKQSRPAGDRGISGVGVLLVVVILFAALLLGFAVNHFFLLLLLLIVLVVVL